jgi:PBP1b-binding outer membrane lipoprotein LpoB
MKLSKYIFVILITAIFISGCNSIKNTLSGKKKENTDEFLVKIKNPLILPPNYDDLPKPVKKTSEENNNNELLSEFLGLTIQLEFQLTLPQYKLLMRH